MDEFAEINLLVVCFCVEGGFDGLPVHCLKDLSGPAGFVEDVFCEGGAMHVPCDLCLQFFVIGYAVGDEICFDHVW